MNVLLILNDPPSPVGHTETALSLSAALARAEGAEVRVFLAGRAVLCAVLAPPTGAGSAGAGSAGAASAGAASADQAREMLCGLISAGVVVGVSEPAMRDHALLPDRLVMGAEPTTVATLAAWCLESERLLVF
jgi:sulfur relay (sulfurtransferase) complex TusBCD TusD component (DsrE family)